MCLFPPHPPFQTSSFQSFCPISPFWFSHWLTIHIPISHIPGSHLDLIGLPMESFHRDRGTAVSSGDLRGTSGHALRWGSRGQGQGCHVCGGLFFFWGGVHLFGWLQRGSKGKPPFFFSGTFFLGGCKEDQQESRHFWFPPNLKHAVRP